MNLQQAIDYINDYSWSTSRLGLERTRELLQRVGDPHRRLKFIHVAGTNGKGSTCAMLESILRQAGYRTGFYPSPYIEDFRERIQVNAEYITEEALTRITERVSREADAMADHPSQFELITAIGMLYFAQMHCDIVVLEVGMGGALDSTNVIDAPLAAVITNIGLDHTEYLGDTVEKIAATKAGIIKSGCHAVSYRQQPSVEAVIRERCSELKVPLRIAGKCHELSSSLLGQCFSYNGNEYRLALLGRHQLENAAVVLETIETLREQCYDIPLEAVYKGLETVKWPARFEVLSNTAENEKAQSFILDGGHNPQCAEAAAAAIREYAAEPDKGEKVTFLIGMLADKDYKESLRIIAPYAAAYVCITPDSPRALKAEELAETITEMYQNERPVRDKRHVQDRSPVQDNGDIQDASCVRNNEYIQDGIHVQNAEYIEEERYIQNNGHLETDGCIQTEGHVPTERHYEDMPLITVCGSVEDAVRTAVGLGRTVVAFGSLYSAGEIRRSYRKLYS